MTDRRDRDATVVSRRSLLGWLACAPGALLLGRSVSGCGSAGGGADGGPRPEAGSDATSGEGGTDGARADGSDACAPTDPDALGPFFEPGAPMRTQLASGDEPGQLLRIEGRLLSAADCRTPLAGYGLELWQADREGRYYEPPDYRLRGRLVTASDGSFAFETIKPGNYRLSGGFRPAHIHVRVVSPAGAERLTTQLYFEGDPYLAENDACQPPSCFSYDPARIVRLSPATIEGRSGELGMTSLFVEA